MKFPKLLTLKLTNANPANYSTLSTGYVTKTLTKNYPGPCHGTRACWWTRFRLPLHLSTKTWPYFQAIIISELFHIPPIHTFSDPFIFWLLHFSDPYIFQNLFFPFLILSRKKIFLYYKQKLLFYIFYSSITSLSITASSSDFSISFSISSTSISLSRECQGFCLKKWLCIAFQFC